MTAHDHTALALFEAAFKQYAERPAFTFLGFTLTFADIDTLSKRFAAYLHHDLGLKPGDRIALQMPNIGQYPVAVYGALRAGLVVVNVNPLYTQRELKHQLNDSGAKALVVLSNVAGEVAQIIDDTAVEQVIVTNIADLMPLPKRLLVNTVVKYIKKMVPEFSFSRSESLLSALDKGKHLKLPNIDINPDDLMVLQYTGGTTGVAKGAMLTQHNLYSNVQQIKAHLPELFSADTEVHAAPLPLYHVYAFNLHLLAGFSSGSHSVLIPNPRDLPSLFKALLPHKITVFVGINTLFNAMLHHAQFSELDYSSLKATSAGGMALTSDTAKHWHQKTGCPITEGYGLTETSPVVSSNPISAIQIGTIGIPVPDTQVKVIDAEGRSLPVGESGELCVKGPQVMKGYWQRPDSTADVLDADGWLATGDIASINVDGYIKIVDRKKDMIIVSGFNVYPNEIEDIVMLHEDVLEAAVVGVPSSAGGEKVKVFIVSENDSLKEEEVIAHCRKHLTAYKVPKLVEFRESLPKTNVGKILRRELRDES